MWLKNFFMGLSQNQMLNNLAQKYGHKLGARAVVAGTTIPEVVERIKELNAAGVSVTVDSLGEFVWDRHEALEAKEQILDVIEAIHEHELEAHISLKPTQLGLGIDYDFCRENLRDIVARADGYGIFVNVDMEDHENLQPSFDLVEELYESFDNIGTVIQAYFFRAKEDVARLKDMRVRIVKGAYKESASVAYQDKADIDKHYLELIEYHLLHGDGFTSIATHDHHVINHVKAFARKHGISRDAFEFQMLYGFRNDLQMQLAREGYRFCTYVPFGKDWYGYFMRRLAERPQNIQLVTKQVLTKERVAVIGVGIGAFLLGRWSKKRCATEKKTG